MAVSDVVESLKETATPLFVTHRHVDAGSPRLRAGSIDDVETFIIAFLEQDLGTMFREVTS